MTTHEGARAFTPIDPATGVGPVSLTVSNLERSIEYYTRDLGFVYLGQRDAVTILGAPGTPLILLTEQKGARPWPTERVTGLYHFAVLLPTRADLGRFLKHWFALGNPMPGQSDHLVSEALYLRDPDEHGIEIYRDRPRSEWPRVNGQVQMATDPLDMRGLLTAAESDGKPWTGMPAGTHMGHIHLQIGDIPQAKVFYRDILGFEIMAEMPTALFISAGGYHHHLGMNIWHSRGARPASPDTARLRFFTVDLPTEEARAAVVARLDAASIAHEQTAGSIVVRDPWQNTILLQVNSTSDAQDAATFAATPS